MRKKIWERWLPAFAAVLAFALILLLPDTAFAKAGDKVDSGEEDGAIAWELVENSDGTDTDPRYTLKLTRKSNGMGYMKDYDNYTTGYRPAMLDRLLSAGAATWRLSADGWPSNAAQSSGAQKVSTTAGARVTSCCRPTPRLWRPPWMCAA